MKKTKLIASLAMAMSIMATIPAMANWNAGQGENSNRWWYGNEDGSYCHSGWFWLDGNRDGLAECYYFDDAGWALMDTTTPDGYTVNADGAWYVGDPDEGVKEKEVEVQYEQAEQDAINKKKPVVKVPEKKNGVMKNYKPRGTGIQGSGVTPKSGEVNAADFSREQGKN